MIRDNNKQNFILFNLFKILLQNIYILFLPDPTCSLVRFKEAFKTAEFGTVATTLSVHRESYTFWQVDHLLCLKVPKNIFVFFYLHEIDEVHGSFVSLPKQEKLERRYSKKIEMILLYFGKFFGGKFS